ncbi:uncharacterized protein FFMR_15799 [Fusarium fujikuroi]|nr:uncharacterized protein FFE2_15823 [Fusarium fujikuroi]SCO25749.1 uncharacterized protein FFC1_15690 [Fusarium fujikuroi]SCO58643.1 uncharacterized protein FFMR_15799 [Fusarium fujikuroi]
MSLACCDGTSSIHPCQSNWKLAPELIPAALLSAENLGIYFASSRILAVTGHSLPPHAAALRSLPTVVIVDTSRERDEAAPAPMPSVTSAVHKGQRPSWNTT